MSTYAAAHTAIESRLNTMWADANVAVRYENEARKLPVGEHIRLSVRHADPVVVGYAGSKILYRRPGIIWVQCFVQAKTGTQRARVIADAVADIFEGQQFSGITCGAASVEELGDDGNGFWQVNAKIVFDHDYERSY